MKPLIIQVPSNKEGKLTLTVKELQEMLDKAYEAGKNDGSCISYTCPHRWWCTYYNQSYTTTNIGNSGEEATPLKITWGLNSTGATSTTINSSNLSSTQTNTTVTL